MTTRVTRTMPSVAMVGRYVDLTREGLRVARPEDPAVVLLQHDDSFAVRLWREVVDAFEGVQCFESIDDAPERVSVVITVDAPLRAPSPDEIPTIVSGRPRLRRQSEPGTLDGPSRYEAATALAGALWAVHQRPFAHHLPAIDERPTVLLVDDETYLTPAWARYLGRLDPYLRVLATASGNEAIELIERERPSVVWLDTFMPPPAGLEILRWMRSRPEFADTPVVVKRGTRYDSDAIIALRPLAVVTEPARAATLIHLVRTALARAGHDVTLASNHDDGFGGAVDDDLVYLDPRMDRVAVVGRGVKRPPVRQPRILVVNDEELVRRIMIRSLRIGFPDAKVTAVEDGLQAIRVLRERSQDLVILDDRMPNLDGFTLVERLRHLPTLKSTAILFASDSCAWRPEHHRHLAPLGYVSLPSSLRDLHHLVASALAYVSVAPRRPDSAWPPYGLRAFEYLDPDFRDALLGGCFNVEPP